MAVVAHIPFSDGSGENRGRFGIEGKVLRQATHWTYQEEWR
jgi:hypothetical protein